MPLRTKRMEEKSAAVRYAVKQYRAKDSRPVKVANPSKEPELKDDLKVVQIKRQPIRRTWEKIKEYFR